MVMLVGFLDKTIKPLCLNPRGKKCLDFMCASDLYFYADFMS